MKELNAEFIRVCINFKGQERCVIIDPEVFDSGLRPIDCHTPNRMIDAFNPSSLVFGSTEHNYALENRRRICEYISSKLTSELIRSLEKDDTLNGYKD